MRSCRPAATPSTPASPAASRSASCTRDQVQFAGVAPMLIYLAERGETVTIGGLGWWPKAPRVEPFIREHGGTIPRAPAHGGAGRARRLDHRARALRHHELRRGRGAGHPLSRARASPCTRHGRLPRRTKAEDYRRWPHERRHLPARRPAAARRASCSCRPISRGRSSSWPTRRSAAAGGGAARPGSRRRATPSTGATSRATIARYHREHGGLLTARRPRRVPRRGRGAAARRASPGIERLHAAARGARGRCCCRCWRCSSADDLAALGHNSPAYVHHLAEAHEALLRRPRALLRRPALRRRADGRAALAGVRAERRR